MSLSAGTIAGIAVGATCIVAILASLLFLLHRRMQRRKTIQKNHASLIRTYGNEEKPYGVSVVVVEQYLKPKPIKLNHENTPRYEMPGLEMWQTKKELSVVQELPGCYGVGWQKW
jgi:hypothetical protein